MVEIVNNCYGVLTLFISILSKNFNKFEPTSEMVWPKTSKKNNNKITL